MFNAVKYYKTFVKSQYQNWNLGSRAVTSTTSYGRVRSAISGNPVPTTRTLCCCTTIDGRGISGIYATGNLN